MLDVLIRGGWVIDGTGSPPFLGDVAVADGKVVEVGRLAPESTATRVIDAAGKTVCPGFVDPHSHSDFSLLANPGAESTIRQGVTTEIVGNCGWSYAPITDFSRQYQTERLHTFGYDGPLIPWSGFGQHLDFISSVGHSPNLAWFVGHNAIRLAAGVSGERPTHEQAEQMDRFMEEAMDAGALGMSTGLEFNPGREASLEELMRLNAIAGRYDGIYTSHVRNRDSAILAAIEEFLEVARAGGIRAEISHFNVRHNTNAPDRGWERAVELMVRARAEGLDVLADTTPFVDGLGQLAGILPPWVAADGTEAALARLKDRDTRMRLRSECDRYWRFIHKGEWDRVRLQVSEQHPEWNGLTFAEIADLRRADPWDCFFDVLVDAGEAYESVLVVGRLFTDDHMAEMISHPLFSLGVDTFTVTDSGPLADVLRHPLGYSGHIHYLTHHVRRNGTLRLEEAVRKMTSMPAAHFGLWDRGLVRAGYAADIVVFDYQALDEVSTVDDPHHYARGIEHVFVNGVAVVDDGAHTGARPGRHLLRST